MNEEIKKREPAGKTYISLDGIDMKIGGSTVLDHIDLEVKKGELLALVGGNGAGKSSILRCMAGLWKPEKGTITINGLDRFEDDLAIRKFTSYLPSEIHIPKYLSVRESIRIFAESYNISEELYRERMDSLLRMFGLKERQDKMLAMLSKGEKKKTALTCSLISGAELYIFDEPFTDGIDPQGYNALRRILNKLAANRNITAIFATQILDMAVSLADRIGVVNYGRLLAIGTVDELRETAKLPKKAKFDEIFAKLASKETQQPAEEYMESL
jgi:ABC-2 type transport system ATP-binding protein